MCLVKRLTNVVTSDLAAGNSVVSDTSHCVYEGLKEGIGVDEGVNWWMMKCRRNVLTSKSDPAGIAGMGKSRPGISR